MMMPNAFYNRGITYKALGQLESALSDFNPALSVQPDLAPALCQRDTVLQTIADRSNP